MKIRRLKSAVLGALYLVKRALGVDVRRNKIGQLGQGVCNHLSGIGRQSTGVYLLPRFLVHDYRSVHRDNRGVRRHEMSVFIKEIEVPPRT